MSRILIIVLVTSFAESLKHCDPAFCSHEGQCFIENNTKNCRCIGDTYFQGTFCTEVVDNCLSNPCQNGGQCQSLVGQFMCRDCPEGYGSLWCDVQKENIFQNLALYFNHYAYPAAVQNFIIVLEDLGSVDFSLELIADNYVIDSFETNPKVLQKQWIYSTDLTAIIRQHGIRYYNDLPFKKGYYRLAQETFWDLGILKITLRSYDTELATDLFHFQVYDLLLLKPEYLKCLPHVKFRHGSDPMDPLLLDISGFNNFEPEVRQRCAANSKFHFHWKIFNSVGNRMLHNFGNSTKPLLKVPPYRLWFNYHGEVMASYSLVVTMVEKFNHSFEAKAEARCFILVLPKPVQAAIRGGLYREVGVEQQLILDGSTSRDFAIAPHVEQALLYRWDCVNLEGDPQTGFCRSNISTGRIVEIGRTHLKLGARYTFTLLVQSTINLFSSNQVEQQVVIVRGNHHFIDIKCIRNCLLNRFSHGHVIHLEARCLSEKRCSPNATFHWTLDDVSLGNAQRCLYNPKNTQDSFQFKVQVRDQGLVGIASMKLTLNMPPATGSCSIKPSKGVAFETDFHIQCENYDDSDAPLSYQYKIQDFPLQRSNDPQALLKLPQCHEVAIVICDQWDACIETQVLVNVSPLPAPANIRDFLAQGGTNVRSLISRGHRLACMILAKSILKYMSRATDALELLDEVESLKLSTLLEVEQWLNICHDLIMSLIPLDNRKSRVLFGYLSILTQGLQAIVADGEIRDIQLEFYENAMHQLWIMIRELSMPWETMVEVQDIPHEMILETDPLSESYNEMPDFDLSVLDRIANWLETSRELHNCFELLSMQAYQMYRPLETPFTMEHGSSRMRIYAFEDTTDHYINDTINPSQLYIPRKDIEDLQRIYGSKQLIFQIGSMTANSFWWYPHSLGVSTNLLYFATRAQKSPLSSLIHLKEPYVFKLRIQNLSSTITFEGVIKDQLHMPIYALEMPSNAALVLNLQNCGEDVLLDINIGSKPKRFQILKSGRIFKSMDATSQSYVTTNRAWQNRKAYIAIMATRDVKKFPFSFRVFLSIIQCLHWDWDSTSPQWSSEGCIAKLGFNVSHELECECFHLSTFAARSYSSPAKEDLRQRLLLESLPFNWNILLFYAVVILICSAIILYNYYRLQNHRYFLMSDASIGDNSISVRIYTGSLENAASTANIQLRFISENGPYSVTIYQTPKAPQLLRNSLTELRLGSQDVQIPLKMTISNSLGGRYPTWYCRKISIFNRTSKQIQWFSINKWISKQTLDVMPSDPIRSFKQKFLDNFDNFYINWFQFQPIFGPLIFTDAHAYQRSCIWISQLMVSLCIVACYYGPTTMESYEEERDLYYSLHFSNIELLALPLACFLSSAIVKSLFLIHSIVS